MPDPTTFLLAQPLDDAAWQPFGWVPRPDSDERDGVDRLHFEWQDAHVNLIRHTRDEISHVSGRPVCAEMFRHLTHTQVLLVMDEPCVIAVAPAGASFERAEDLAQIEAFSLSAGDSLVLHQGTWHWGPFPLGSPVVTLFNVQGRRYIEDNDRVSLDHLGAVVCVSVPPG